MRHWILVALLFGCEPPCGEYTKDIVSPTCATEAERKQLAEAIVSCAKAANPMSDEEGEDLVAQCEGTMARTVCPERKQRVVYSCHHIEQWRRTLP